MPRYLIVANQTLGGEQLVARITTLLESGPTTLRFAVPVTDTEGTRQWDYPPTDRYIPDAHQIATWLAEDRLRRECPGFAAWEWTRTVSWSPPTPSNRSAT